MIIKWNEIVDEISKMTFKYDREKKIIYVEMKDKTSYLYKLLKGFTPKLIHLWKQKYEIDLDFDLMIPNKQRCRIMGCKESQLVILRNIEQVDYSYFQYVINHKLNVIRNGIGLLEFLGLKPNETPKSNIFFLHDMSKFSRHEWSVYANYFYNSDGTQKIESQKVDTPESEQAFNHHYMNNAHHTEYHNKDNILRPMTLFNIFDMFADWKTMSNFYKNDIYKWYRENESDLKFHHLTKLMVENLLVKCEDYYKDKKYIKCNFK